MADLRLSRHSTRSLKTDREEAKKAGDVRYLGGECKRGHNLRYVLNNICVRCNVRMVLSNGSGSTLSKDEILEQKRQRAEEILDESRLRKELDEWGDE